MKIQDFDERLKNSILIADGAMGSLLYEWVGSVRCFDELNVTEPEAVFRVHQAYIEAGAQIIETNTFGANRFKLAPLGLGEDVQKLNGRGVKIAREARESAAREVIIAGSIGPLGIGMRHNIRNQKRFCPYFTSRPWHWKNGASISLSWRPFPTLKNSCWRLMRSGRSRDCRLLHS